MSKFIRRTGFNWLHAAKFGLDKHDDNSSQNCLLELDLEYPKELHELHKYYYPLAPEKLEVKKLVPNFFSKEKYMLHSGTYNIFKNRINITKVYHCIRI